MGFINILIVYKVRVLNMYILNVKVFHWIYSVVKSKSVKKLKKALD